MPYVLTCDLKDLSDFCLYTKYTWLELKNGNVINNEMKMLK